MTISKVIFWKQEILVAVGHSSWKFQVDGVDEMLLIPDMNEAIVYELKELTGTGFKKYVMAFNIDRDIKESTIAHEVWHLFMNILELVSGDTSYTANELAKESYAFLFGELFELIDSTVRESIKEVDHDA